MRVAMHLAALAALAALATTARADLDGDAFTSTDDGVRIEVPRGWRASDQSAYPHVLLTLSRSQPRARVLLEHRLRHRLARVQHDIRHELLLAVAHLALYDRDRLSVTLYETKVHREAMRQEMIVLVDGARDLTLLCQVVPDGGDRGTLGAARVAAEADHEGPRGQVERLARAFVRGEARVEPLTDACKRCHLQGCCRRAELGVGGGAGG